MAVELGSPLWLLTVSARACSWTLPRRCPEHRQCRMAARTPLPHLWSWVAFSIRFSISCLIIPGFKHFLYVVMLSQHFLQWLQHVLVVLPGLEPQPCVHVEDYCFHMYREALVNVALIKWQGYNMLTWNFLPFFVASFGFIHLNDFVSRTEFGTLLSSVFPGYWFMQMLGMQNGV